MIKINISTKKRMRTTLFIVFLVITILIGRLGYIQLIQGKELSKLAYEQQTLDRKIDICSKAFSGRNLGLINTKDFIDLDKTANLRQDLIDFYQKDMVDACEYCLISTEKVAPALQIKDV